MGFPSGSAGKESTCNSGDLGLIPGLGIFPGEGKGYPLQYSWAFLVAQLMKNQLQCGRPGFDPWVGNTPGRRERLPTSVFCAGELHKLSPHCCKESDTTERIILACSSLSGVSCDFSFFISGFINMSSLLFSWGVWLKVYQFIFS